MLQQPWWRNWGAWGLPTPSLLGLSTTGNCWEEEEGRKGGATVTVGVAAAEELEVGVWGG